MIKYLLIILLYLVIAATTFHPDLRVFTLASRFISQGEVLTFYDHFVGLTNADPLKKLYVKDDVFVYPPLAYWLPHLFYLPFNLISPKLFDQIVFTTPSLFSPPYFSLVLVLAKLPLLFALFLGARLIGELIENPKRKRLAQLIFLINPVSLFVVAAQGQVDIFLTVFLILYLLAVSRQQFSRAAIWAVLAALIKPIGLIFLPLLFVFLWRRKNFLISIRSLAPAAILYFLGLAPYLFSPAFRFYVLQSDLAQKTIFAGIAVSPATIIPWFFIVYFLVLLWLFKGRLDLRRASFIVLFASLAFNHFHPQWFLWLSPWLIPLALSPRWPLALAALLAWVFIWFSFDPSLHYGLFLATHELFPATQKSLLDLPLLVTAARAYLVALLFFFLQSPAKHD